MRTKITLFLFLCVMHGATGSPYEITKDESSVNFKRVEQLFTETISHDEGIYIASISETNKTWKLLVHQTHGRTKFGLITRKYTNPDFPENIKSQARKADKSPNPKLETVLISKEKEKKIEAFLTKHEIQYRLNYFVSTSTDHNPPLIRSFKKGFQFNAGKNDELSKKVLQFIILNASDTKGPFQFKESKRESRKQKNSSDKKKPKL